MSHYVLYELWTVEVAIGLKPAQSSHLSKFTNVQDEGSPGHGRFSMRGEGQYRETFVLADTNIDLKGKDDRRWGLAVGHFGGKTKTILYSLQWA